MMIKMLLLLLAILPANGYNILMYSIKYGYSHMNYIGSIADTLQAAGHNVTVIQPEVDVNLKMSGCYKARVIEVPVDKASLEAVRMRRESEKGENVWTSTTGDPSSLATKAPSIANIYASAMQNVLNQKELMNSLREIKWDIGIFEMLDYGGYPVLYEAGVENIIGDLSVVFTDRVASILGLPNAWSYVPALQGSLSDDGTFTTRLYNLVYAYYSWQYERIVETAGQNYMDKHHPEASKIWEVVSNMPVVLTNSEPLIDFPRPILHKVVDIGGIGLKEPKQLDKVELFACESGKIQEWSGLLNKRKMNVLISFGTLMKSTLMPQDYKENIIAMVKRFPEVTFIWKYETPEDGVGKGVPNLYLSRWMPQTDLLASGKINLFVAHGGAASVLESTTHGVPMISISIFFDQYRNSRMIERFGHGMLFDKNDLKSADKIEAIIKRGLADEKLHERAKLAAEILKNRPFTPQEKLIRHVELAVKFGSNLTSWTPTGRHFYLVQFYNLDIYALLIGISLCLSFIVHRIFQFVCSGKRKNKIE